MESFYAKYNPYYNHIKNGMDKLQRLFSDIVTSPHMDTASCRTLYDDIERCIQDIYYTQKRSTMLFLFDEKFVEDLKLIEYAHRIQ